SGSSPAFSPSSTAPARPASSPHSAWSRCWSSCSSCSSALFTSGRREHCNGTESLLRRFAPQDTLHEGPVVTHPLVKNAGEEPWVTTRLDFLVNWGRANSLWPMPFGTACCAIEFMATAASGFDL